MAASGFTPVCNRFLPRNPTSARQHHPPIRPSRHQAPLDLPALAPRQGLCSGRFMPRAEPNGSEAGICGVQKEHPARTLLQTCAIPQRCNNRRRSLRPGGWQALKTFGRFWVPHPCGFQGAGFDSSFRSNKFPQTFELPNQLSY